MKLNFLFKILIFSSLFISCGSISNKKNVSKNKSSSYSSSSPKSTKVIADARKYIGTRYKYGGTTKKGMDCSGLVYTTFQQNNITLPRTSAAMSTKGKRIKLGQVKKGDLLFFRTSKTSSKINHVGVVSKISGSKVYFVHSSTSKGVIESSLSSTYWNKAFRFANRIL